MDLSSPSSMGGFMLTFQIINMIFLLAIICCSVYGLALFIKLAKRGIKALDIYIEKNQIE